MKIEQKKIGVIENPQSWGVQLIRERYSIIKAAFPLKFFKMISKKGAFNPHQFISKFLKITLLQEIRMNVVS